MKILKLIKEINSEYLLMHSNENKSSFSKSIFTLCDYRENDKCPPGLFKLQKCFMIVKKKTIYYDNAVIKVYDIPIFYLPRLSHPDPTVDRRSGFLPPSFSDSKNLGAGVSIPYFWAVKNDKNFTVTSKFYYNENPLFMGEYHQAFENSNLLQILVIQKVMKMLPVKNKLVINPTSLVNLQQNFLMKQC